MLQSCCCVLYSEVKCSEWHVVTTVPCLFLSSVLAGNQTSVHQLEQEVASDTAYTVYHIRLICLLRYTLQYYCTQSTYIDSSYRFTYSKYLDDLTLFCTFVSLIFLRILYTCLATLSTFSGIDTKYHQVGDMICSKYFEFKRFMRCLHPWIQTTCSSVVMYKL